MRLNLTRINCRFSGNAGKVSSYQTTYFARPDFSSLARQMYRNAIWLLPLVNRGIQPRHIAPFAAMLGGLALLFLGVWWKPAWWALGALVALYVLVDVAVTVNQAKRLALGFVETLCLLVTFPLAHISYGVGWFASLCSPSIWRVAYGLRNPPPRFGEESGQ